ncbi:MAG: MlaD family protein [Rhodospirillales bacterium]
MTAVFPRVDGLSKGAEVRLGGIRIGGVEAMRLTELKRAEVTMRIQDSVKIPADSAAIILSNGLVGAKFIELDPGGDEKMLTAGDRLRHTQGSIIVEELMELIIGQIKARQARLAADEKQDGER